MGLGVVRGALLVVWALVVAVATLSPVYAAQVLPEGLCLICGDTGGADALRNVILFLPLGAILGSALHPGWRVAGIALAISTGAELLQLVIPGRHPSLGDIFFNGAGAVLGLALPRFAVQAVRGSASARRTMGAASLALATAVVVAPAVLGIGAEGRGRLHVRLRPDFSHLALLPGTIQGASVAGTPLKTSVLMPGDPLGHRLRDGSRLQVEFTLDAPLDEHRETGLLRVHDDPGGEVVFLGFRKDVLVYRERLNGNLLHLEVPATATLIGRTPTGAPLTAWVERTDRGRCLGLSRGGREETVDCGLGLTAGSAWRFLADPAIPRTAQAGISFLWVLALVLPFGLTGPRKTTQVLGICLLWGAMLAATGAGPLVIPSVWEVLAVPAGLGLGYLVRSAPQWSLRGERA